MDTKVHLGNGIYLATNVFGGKKLYHVRKYEQKEDGGTFPTQIGACFTASRFVSLLDIMDDIDTAYELVSQGKASWLTVHIKAQLYASVTAEYKCINLRQFFKAPDGRVIPTKRGISLPLPIWRTFKTAVAGLRESDSDLKSAAQCGVGLLEHHNQLGYMECRECNPFGADSDPSVVLPPSLLPYLLRDTLDIVMGEGRSGKQEDGVAIRIAPLPNGESTEQLFFVPNYTPSIAQEDDEEETIQQPKKKRCRVRLNAGDC